MNYMIVFINEYGEDWCVLETDNRIYARRVYTDIVPLNGYRKELRATKEDTDTHLDYTVIA